VEDEDGVLEPVVAEVLVLDRLLRLADLGDDVGAGDRPGGGDACELMPCATSVRMPRT
jgi:hypothetical protein